MTDFRTLDASEELDALVALALGWTKQTMPHGLESWFSPDGRQWAKPPRYSQDLNLAWELLVAQAVRIHTDGALCWAQVAQAVRIHTDGALCWAQLDAIDVSAPTLSVAICRAFLAWKNFAATGITEQA